MCGGWSRGGCVVCGVGVGVSGWSRGGCVCDAHSHMHTYFQLHRNVIIIITYLLFVFCVKTHFIALKHIAVIVVDNGSIGGVWFVLFTECVCGS